MRSKIIKLCKSIILASLFGFVFYFLLVTLLAAIVENNPYKDIFISCCMVIIYHICFFVVHERRRENLYADPTAHFSYCQELKRYLIVEGRYILLLYAICVTAVEISMLVSGNNPANPIGTLFAMIFPLMPYIPVPVVRSIISLLLCALGNIVLVLLQSRKINKLHSQL